MKFCLQHRVCTPCTHFQYHPNGQTFATASEDKSARLFDIRSDQQIASYAPPNANSGFTSCGKNSASNIPIIHHRDNHCIFCKALSLSGRYILCGSDDNNIHAWDTLKTCYNGNFMRFFLLWLSKLRVVVSCIGSLHGHENRVTSICMAPNGMALASCSWDNYVRVWV